MAKQKVRKPVDLDFPIGGLNRASAFQSQRPYTTPYCANVRPFDVVNADDADTPGMRHRGGARPGIEKTYAEQCGDGPIQHIGVSSSIGTDGVASHVLVTVADGTLYQNASGSFASVSGSFNSSAKRLQGTQLGTKYYIADYRSTNKIGTDGTIASTNRLSDSTVADWTALSIDTDNDVVWISGDTDTESNIFPITSVETGYIVIDGTMTNQSGGATWQLGRIPKVFDPANPTDAVTGLMGDLPIPDTSYRVGTVTSVDGTVTLTGGTWEDVPEPTAENQLALTVPNTNGIGTQHYLIATKDSNTQVTLVDQTDNADRTGVNYAVTWASDYYGIPPLNCPLCCTYRGRLVFAGPGAIWYMSRILDADDWEYGYDPNDPARAIGGTSTQLTGGVPDQITALIPHSDQYLIFGCERSLWMLTCDAGWCGQITALSREVGVMGPNAWCSMPDGSTIFMSRDGLYRVRPGQSSYPDPISRPLLPAELLNLDWTSNSISLRFDIKAQGFHLSVTPDDGTTGTHFFIDVTKGTFWPVTLPDAMQPTAMTVYAPDATDVSQVVFGGFDGYVRNYDDDATDDDGTDFVSVVTYGPIRIGGPGRKGRITMIAADLDSAGSGGDWGIYNGNTPQEAVVAAVAGAIASEASWTGSWDAGYNVRAYPRAPGGASVIMFSGGEDWAIEGMRVTTKELGPIR